MTYQPPEPDSFERMMYYIENVIDALHEGHDQYAHECLELARAQANELASDVDDWDGEVARIRAKIRARPPDVQPIVDGAMSFLHQMHELYLNRKKGD